DVEAAADAHRAQVAVVARVIGCRCEIRVGEVAHPLRGRRHQCTRNGIVHYPPELLRIEEKSLVPAVVEVGQDHRTACREAKIVVAQHWPWRKWRSYFVEVVICVEDVVAKELIGAA